MYDVTLSIYANESSRIFHVHLERKMRSSNSSVTNVKRVVTDIILREKSRQEIYSGTDEYITHSLMITYDR